jgi:hypothetical protein
MCDKIVADRGPATEALWNCLDGVGAHSTSDSVQPDGAGLGAWKIF